MFVLKQIGGNCTHYSIVDSIEAAVSELSCEQAYLFEIDTDCCNDAETIIAVCKTLEEAGDYDNLFEVIRDLSTQKLDVTFSTEEE